MCAWFICDHMWCEALSFGEAFSEIRGSNGNLCAKGSFPEFSLPKSCYITGPTGVRIHVIFNTGLSGANFNAGYGPEVLRLRTLWR